MLTEDRFRAIVRDTPLVSIDFIVRRNDGAVLLGMRQNRPAQGFWFAPGGRIFKNETLDIAQRRIFEAETGNLLDATCLRLMGVYQHLYEDNVFGDPGFGTHYIVLGYEVQVAAGFKPQADRQHCSLRWRQPQDLLRDDAVHPCTKDYLR